MRLQNKTAFITGAGSGLGRAAAQRFAEEGAMVIAADIDGEAATETVDSLESSDGKGDVQELDVTDADAVQAAVDATVESYGLDIIVNNAGLAHERGPVEEMDQTELENVVDVNIYGVWNGCKAALHQMKEQGSGSIINTASFAGITGVGQLAAYSMTKGAVVTLTHAIAAEAGPAGVRANAVCPAVTDTPMAQGDTAPEEWEDLKPRMGQQYPLRRLGRPEDQANAMLFLASDEADWITGETLSVDGGYSVSET